MKITKITKKIKLLLIIFFFGFIINSNVFPQGYYKDLFMDGGVNLTSRTSLPSADYINLSMEYIATSDTAIQRSVMIGNVNDINGVLLYPDGEPRFRAIYTNGGSATNHGNSLGNNGRERVRTFFNNGGSYTGSCAGMFISSLHYKSTGIWGSYYHIWPGRTEQANLATTYTGHFIQTGSALLDYYDFGGDMYIDNVYHNYGGFARETIDFPAETEVLLRYDYSAKTMHQKPSCWAYKKLEEAGRVVVIGSHPESITSGERRDLMAAILQYALDGEGNPTIKDSLISGELRSMNKSTNDHDPKFTKIGDKQYHHFTIELSTISDITITLDGEDGYDFNLYVANEEFAFENNTDFSNTSSGSDKIIYETNLSAGTWYIGVECANTVSTTKRSWGYEYTGNVNVLNGVSYDITAEWSIPSGVEENIAKNTYLLHQNYPNPFNPKTTIEYILSQYDFVTIKIFNLNGQLVKTLVSEKQYPGSYKVQFDGSNFSSGVYFYQLKTANYLEVKKMILVK